MNEQEIGSLMEKYRDEMGACSRLPQRRTRNVLLKRGSLAVATVGVFVVAGVLLAPGDATAAAVRKVGSAIQNANSMIVVSFYDGGGKTMRKVGTTYFQDGAWRSEWGKGRGMETMSVSRDGRLLINIARFAHATIEPLRPEEERMSDEGDAVGFAKELTNYGAVSEGRTTSIQDSGVANGVPTYTIVMDRDVDYYHAEILVDKRNNLPITAKYQMGYGGGNGVLHYRHDFTFNKRLDPELFSFDTGKRLIDIPVAQQELGQTWKQSLGKVCSSTIRSAVVTGDGTVWIVVGTDKENHDDLPTELTSDAGTEYVRIPLDLTPSSIKGRVPAKIGGESILIVGFAPLDPNARLPKRVEVRLAHRTSQPAGFGPLAQIPVEMLRPAVKLAPEREPGTFPDYFPALDLDVISHQLPYIAWKARGEALEEKGQFLKAAQAYEQSSAAFRSFIGRDSKPELRSAAECYEKAGQTNKH